MLQEKQEILEQREKVVPVQQLGEILEIMEMVEIGVMDLMEMVEVQIKGTGGSQD